MKRPAATANKNIAMLRARIARGGDLDPVTLSRSFGVAVGEVEKILEQSRRHS